MKKFFFEKLIKIPVIWGIYLLLANNSVAAETIFQLTEDPEMEQIESVSKLRDVEPTDWVFTALVSLVEKYDCIEGFKGKSAISRSEFAASLNICINQMAKLLAVGEVILLEDREKLQRLNVEFAGELAELATQLDKLENGVAVLESNQFSPTSTMNGEVIFALVNAFESEGINNQMTMSDRLRLNFNTSFTGKDSLKFRLQAGNIPRLDRTTGTDMARLGFDFPSNNNNLEISDIRYIFPITNKLTAWVAVNAFEVEVVEVANPYLANDSRGALSRFGRRNPLVYRPAGGTGVTLKYQLQEQLNITAAYLVNTGGNPEAGQGLFQSSFSTGVQLDFSPSDNLIFALTYLHTYQRENEVNVSSATGSLISRQPFGQVPTTSDRLGFQAGWHITKKINIATWVGYATAEAKDGINQGANADLWTWNANISFLDLGKEGSLLAFAWGMPPKVTSIDNGLPHDPDTSYIIEALYRYPLTDNIVITPGGYVILNPNHDEENNTVWVVVIRTTFKF